MARKPRLVIAGTPLHLTQRGVDRSATFLADQDFAYYLWALTESSRLARCAVHAYALMTNHVHLLLTPHDAAGPSSMMVALGRRYVRYFNDRYRRTGTLWEGRFRSSLVLSDRQFLQCSRYIELNPVRAGLAAHAGGYPWTSYRHNTDGLDDPVITSHAIYTALGRTGDERRAAYRALVGEADAPRSLAQIRATIHSSPELPISRYRQLVEAMGVDGARAHHHAQA